MEIKIFGIKNCDTMKKTFQLFEREKVGYQFVDYKNNPPDETLLLHFLSMGSLDELINKRGTTYRRLDGENKELLRSSESAVPLLMKHSSMIKRPIVQFPNGKIIIGLQEEELLKCMKIQ